MRSGVIVRRLFIAIVAVAGLFLAYRFATAYTWRRGTCATITPAPLSAAAVPAVSIMSFNIQGHAAFLDADHIRDIAEVIVREKPDVVGLQEVHVGTWQSRGADQLKQLAALTGMKGVFGPALRSLGGAYGNAVLTRGEIGGSEVYDLPGFGEPRSLLRATIRIDGAEMDVFVTHLAAWGRLNRKSRKQQADCVAARVGNSGRPYLLVGDLNASPGDDELRAVLRGGPLRPSGNVSEPTHKVTGQRLDFILTDPRWITVSSRVLDVDPSDHKPLLSHVQRGAQP